MKLIRNLSLIAIIFLMVFFSYSCEKLEGEGGTSTITGRVLVKKYNDDFTEKISEYYSQGVDVYIIYGKDSLYSDDFETGLNGWYRFEYLYKGKYKVYAMSKDSSGNSLSGMVPVVREVVIDENNSTFVVDDIVIFE